MDKTIPFLTKNAPYFAVLIAVILGFEKSYGLECLLPGNINWLMSVYHDWGQYYVGWAYFENEPWHFPIGKIEHFNYPAGTNIGYTDSIPLMAILFKCFSAFLPETFQYFGIWLFMCHLLLGYYCLKLFQLFNVNSFVSTAGAILVALNPLLIYVGMHPSTCVHWLIMASIYYYFLPVNSTNIHQFIRKQLLWVLFAAWVNPYMFLFVLAFTCILLFKHWRHSQLISFKTLFLYLLSVNTLVIISWYIIGLISFGNEVDMEVQNSYGLYGFNLNSFFNSGGFSNYLPELPYYKPHQYEGYAYLGIGLIIFVIFNLIVFAFRQTRPSTKIHYQTRWTPLLLMSICLGLFAITNQVTFNEHLLVEFPIPELFKKFGSVFRASGRYMWVSYYLIISFTVIFFDRIPFNRVIKVLFIFLILIVQLIEWPHPKNQDRSLGDYQPERITVENWAELSSHFERIITYPLHHLSLNYYFDYQDICYAILPSNVPITTGYVARETSAINNACKDSLHQQLIHKGIAKDELYITSKKHLPSLKKLMTNAVYQIGKIDEYYFLCSSSLDLSLSWDSQIEVDSSSITSVESFKWVDTSQIKQGSINSNIESWSYSNRIINTSGWAFDKHVKNNQNDSIFIGLTLKNKTYLIPVNSVERKDVTQYFEQENLDKSGFEKITYLKGLERGKYAVQVLIKKPSGLLLYDTTHSALKIRLE